MKNNILLFTCILATSIALGQSPKKDSANFNKALAAELDTIRYEDQNNRGQLQQLYMKGIKDTNAFMAMVAVMRKKDSVNRVKVEAILDKYGWVGPDMVGANGNMALFLVIQHSGQKVQEKYLPMMREAVKDGRASAQNLALLEDKVRLGEGKKQLYGSQLGRDPKTGAIMVSPIEDLDNVDKRRTAIGLQTMSDYCKMFQITWDLDRYKKGLPLEPIKN